MSKNEIFRKDVQEVPIQEPLSDAQENSGSLKFISRLKKIIYITFLAGMGLYLNGCMAGYVATEPVYVEFSRPAPPSTMHVWIDGDWGWNSRSHVYVQRAGYWEKPRQGQTFVSGHWQSTPKGKAWSRGHWQRQGHQGNRRN